MRKKIQFYGLLPRINGFLPIQHAGKTQQMFCIFSDWQRQHLIRRAVKLCRRSIPAWFGNHCHQKTDFSCPAKNFFTTVLIHRAHPEDEVASFRILFSSFSLCNSATSAHMENQFNGDAAAEKTFLLQKVLGHNLWPNVTDTNVADADEAFANLFHANISC